MIDKKKAKEEYKRRIPEKGIFAVRNNKNGKVLLGGSLNLSGILDREKFILELSSHKNKELQQDWKTFGSSAFSFEILEKLKLKDDPAYNYDEDLKILEMMWVEKFQPLAEKTYNKTENIRTV